MPPPPRKTAKPNRVTFQVNRVFENREHIESYIKTNAPGATIGRVWEVKMLACEIETESINSHLVKKKKK